MPHGQCGGSNAKARAYRFARVSSHSGDGGICLRRAWFKSVTAPNGVPCCDISDSHRTTYDVRQGAYWVPIDGEWMAVPERAVIRDRGNPVGEAVVWYVHHRGGIIISCFVPADTL